MFQLDSKVLNLFSMCSAVVQAQVSGSDDAFCVCVRPPFRSALVRSAGSGVELLAFATACGLSGGRPSSLEPFQASVRVQTRPRRS